MGKTTVLCLMALCAPLAQGIGFKLDLKPELKPELQLRPELKPELKPGLQPELQPERMGSRSASAFQMTRAMTDQALQFFDRIENGSSKRPLLLMNLKSAEVVSLGGDFMPSEEFLSSGEVQRTEHGEELRQEQGQGQRLPWGIHNPCKSNWAVHQGCGMPGLNFPVAGIEYSMEAAGNIQSFSKNKEDLKFMCQVLDNVTNGFYLDTQGGNGEQPSNTMLLELAGWRGLIMEHDVYNYAELWGKMRKAWLFLGSMSPHENATKVGWDVYDSINENSGRQLHAYPIQAYIAEMGGLKTVDFWNLHSGCFEAEILNETLLHSGSHVEFGVVLVTFCGRTTGLGDSQWVQARSRSDTETLIFQIFSDAGFNFLGGLDARFNDEQIASYEYGSILFVNPEYFTGRGLPVPTAVKAAAPLQTASLHQGTSWQSVVDNWDEGLTHDQEVDCISDYIRRSRAASASTEAIPYAHRINQADVVHAAHDAAADPPLIRQKAH